MEQKPIINTPIDQFIKPMLDTWAKCKIRITFNRVEKGILYLNVDKRVCMGCKGNSIRTRIMKSVRKYYPNIVAVQLIAVAM